ncbi:TniQ family protein [Streptomyces sp. NPDC050636]|uniref:TniQ family protein n=1 Tax=Streptomyces sp. NPDC050636 TaxID=3154510 RepID=UPI0034337212
MTRARTAGRPREKGQNRWKRRADRMRQRPSTALPRSLAPIAGESITGFLLRLSFRLRESPAYLCWRTGLNRNNNSISVAPTRHLIMLAPDQLQTFSYATRMSFDDADRLTFRPYAETYPPISETLMSREGQAPRPRGALPAWLLANSTRYCPSCLAGDGSPIQDLYGGPWKLLWHLPITFACIEHQVMLQDLCPACQLPAQDTHSASTRVLLPNPTRPGLHPLQCRNIQNSASGRRLCGHRLDDRSLSEITLTPELATLQQTLIHRLHETEDPAASFLAFSNIRVMAAIISATWPKSANLIDLPSELKLAFDQHRELQDQAAQATDTTPRRGSRHPSLWSTAPRSAPAMAALLSIANHIVEQPVPELRQTARILLESAPHPSATRWGTIWRTFQRDTSPLFRHEFEDAFRRRFPAQPAPGWTKRPDPTACLIPVLDRGYRAANIPQELPDTWFDLFVEASAPTPLPRARWCRRAAAVQLVQAATGMPMSEAARYLGIPTSWMGGYIPRLKAFPKRCQSSRHAIPAALERLAKHVANSQDKVDYRERRDEFELWHLPVQAWDGILDQVPEFRKTAHRYPILEPLRGCASAYIWSKLTGSEWNLAPGFLRTPSGADRSIDGDSYEIRTMRKLRSWHEGKKYLPSYKILAEHLELYADGILCKSSEHGYRL